MIPVILIHVPFAVRNAVKGQQLGDMPFMRNVLLTVVDPGRDNPVTVGAEQQNNANHKPDYNSDYFYSITHNRSQGPEPEAYRLVPSA